jgi:hypothetical protein
LVLLARAYRQTIKVINPYFAEEYMQRQTVKIVKALDFKNREDREYAQKYLIGKAVFAGRTARAYDNVNSEDLYGGCFILKSIHSCGFKLRPCDYLKHPLDVSSVQHIFTFCVEDLVGKIIDVRSGDFDINPFFGKTVEYYKDGYGWRKGVLNNGCFTVLPGLRAANYGLVNGDEARLIKLIEETFEEPEEESKPAVQTDITINIDGTRYELKEKS